MDRKFLPDAVNVPTISFNNLLPSFFHRGYCCFMNGVPRRYADFLFSVYDDMGTEALDDQMLEGTEGGPVDDGTMDEGAADATGSGDAEVQ